jgi:hypothetical protein
MRLLTFSKSRTASLISEVWAFDATYSAHEDVDSRVDALAPDSPWPSLFVYFLPRTDTADQARKLRDQKNRPANIHVVESDRTSEQGIHAHFSVSIRHWRERIRDSQTLR